VRITLLGAVEVWPDGSERRPMSLSGPRLRGLLARLALDAGRPVAVSELVDDLWGDAPPDGAANALQALVSRLRRAIGADLVDTAARGYQLRVQPEAVDALQFAALPTTDAADDTAAHTLLGQALALWRGPALADVLDLPFAGPVAHRLAERRAVAVERRARLALELGQPADELDTLRAQLDAAPLHESTAVLRPGRCRLSVPDSAPSTAAYCPVSPICRRTAAGSATTRARAARAARVRSQQGGQHPHCGGLAGAVRPEQTEHGTSPRPGRRRPARPSPRTS
jgi:DNA-binding winged helix-turn-helix (wHTH) protein